MLANSDRELLTAYVDGELSARQRKAVLRLLRRSPEARALLQELQADSELVRSLPHPPPAPDLSASVLDTIQRRGLRPRRTLQPVHEIPVWSGLAVAAAVLLVIGAASFFYFSSVLAPDAKRPSIAETKKPPFVDAKKTDGPPDEKKIPVEKGPDPTEKKPDEKKTPPVFVEKPPEKSNIQIEPPSPDDIVTSPGKIELIQPESADVALPVLFKARDLDLESVRPVFVRELSRQGDFYLDLLCRDATVALPKLQSALKAANVELTVDGTAAARLRSPSQRTVYLVVLEDVTPDELARLLAQVANDDPKMDKKNPLFGQFASSDPNLVVCRMTADMRRRMAPFVGGTELRPVERPTGPLGVDLSKPLSDQTPAEIAATLSGSNKNARQGLVVAYNIAPSRTPSAEVKRWLDARKPVRKGTVQVYLVLRARPST